MKLLALLIGLLSERLITRVNQRRKFHLLNWVMILSGGSM